MEGGGEGGQRGSEEGREVDQINNIRNVSIIISNNKLMSFTDTVISNEHNEFIRTLDNGIVIHYKDPSPGQLPPLPTVP